MKRIAFVIGLLTFTCSVVRAQQEYFMFILADNQQPFYVRLGDKTYSSSGIGHLVIPRLKDTAYNLFIGFPRKQYPEQFFAVTPNGKDLDYRLRNSESDGWNLVNGQTAQTIKGRQDEIVKTDAALGERRTGGFAVLLSGLVNDSAVMYKTVARINTPPAPALVTAPTPEQNIAAPVPVTPVPVTQTDSGNTTVAATTPPATPIITTTGDSATASAPDSTVTASLIPRSVILEVQEWWNEKGKGYIYYDSTLVGIDTISILVEYGPPKMINPDQAVDGPAKKDSVKATITEAPVWAQQPGAAAADSTRKQTDSAVTTISAEKIVPPVVPVATTTNATDSGNATALKPVEEKAIPVPTVSAPPAVTTLDSAKQAQATTAGNAKVDSVKAISESVAKAAEVVAATAEVPKKDAAIAVEKAAAPIEEPVKKDSLKEAAENKKQLLMMNSDCVNFATETDVDKLRVKMLNTADVDDRIAAAKKVFKTKCFVTRYIRGLSELFPNEEARFRFFDAAYPYVSDSGRFRTLVDLFTEDLWIARFKALVRM